MLLYPLHLVVSLIELLQQTLRAQFTCKASEEKKVERDSRIDNDKRLQFVTVKIKVLHEKGNIEGIPENFARV